MLHAFRAKTHRLCDEEHSMPAPYWPRPNRFLDALRSPTPPVFMWMTLESPILVETAGAYGLDAVIIDLEHTSADMTDARSMIVAAQGAGMTALVRPSSHDRHVIGRLLDAGADGIVFAQVTNAEEADAAYRSVRYPPDGTRGWAGMHARHVRWNLTPPDEGDHALTSPEFAAAANARVASIFMIESQAGLDNLDDTLDRGQPDGVIYGWADYGVSIGFDEAAIAAGQSRIYDACRARGIGLALNVVPAETLEYFPGCFLSAGTDASVASEALRVRLARSKELADDFARSAATAKRRPPG
jgi:4-hydroxy-2-oxoheptanedioate aldolase